MAELSVTALRVVREVARHGAITAAAARLGYTQSAVSRQLSLAERAAGRVLFERHPRGVRLTAAGGIVVRHAEAVLAEIETAHQELGDLDALPRGRMRIGAFSTALSALVPRAFAAFARLDPRTELVLREGMSPALAGRVRDGRLDLAVVTTEPDPPDGLDVTVLLDDPLLVAVHRGHPLAGERSVPADELRRERWIAGSSRPGSSLLGAWTGSAWEPEIIYVARDWNAKLGFAAAGLGVTVVPGLAVPSLRADVELVRIDHPAASRRTAMVTRAGDAADPRREGLGEALRDAAAEIATEVRQYLGRH